jgi:hypothetical protein
LSAATATVITLVITYAIDTYPELAGESMITVIVIRNTMGFAITYAWVFPTLLTVVSLIKYRATPWIVKLGVQNTFISAGFLAMATTMTFLLEIKWGKKLRVMSKDRYWAYVAEGKAMGLAHWSVS